MYNGLSCEEGWALSGLSNAKCSHASILPSSFCPAPRLSHQGRNEELYVSI